MPSEMSSADIEEYDFVLVGAGSASCLIASRLSRDLPTHRILVLEAGAHVRNDPKVQTPGLSASLQSDPKYDWDYLTSPEPGLNNRRVRHPRGKLVGGTSAINSHSVVFPNHEWHDRIAFELLSGPGQEEWSAEGMRDCYVRWQAEDTPSPEHDDRLRTSFQTSTDHLQSQWPKAFEELGHQTQTTGFVKSSPGAVIITNAIDSSKGERSHAATAFMEPALERGNVTLMTGATVNKIEFDEGLDAQGMLRANGVRYTHEGEQRLIRAREVIVSAGVFESPLILERSGIGSKTVLGDAGIPVLYELPGVGENLQDHLNCSLAVETQDHIPTRDNILRSPELQKASVLEYERSRSGRLAEGPAYSFAFTPLQMLESTAETRELSTLVDDLVKAEQNPSFQSQYTLIQQAIESPHEATATSLLLRLQRNRDEETFPDQPRIVDGNYVTVVAMLAHPFSRGTCHITTSDPAQKPAIKFNYLSHPLDTEILARHLRLIDRLFQTRTFTAMTQPDGRRLPRSHPHPISSLEDAKNMLPINAATNYHPCGTCAMMRLELGGVVDQRLMVYGTKNVRVCDASVLPIIPRGNILTAVYAFAEKAAELIVQEARAGETSS